MDQFHLVKLLVKYPTVTAVPTATHIPESGSFQMAQLRIEATTSLDSEVYISRGDQITQ